MRLEALFPIIIGIVLLLKPDIPWLINVRTGRTKSIGFEYRRINPASWSIMFVRILALAGIVLGLLYMFEIINVTAVA